jgi:nitrite reductase/ring-hydroxylating ferredoxin subunit
VNSQTKVGPRTKTTVVAAVDEIPPHGRKIVEVDGVSIGIYNYKGEFYAVRNFCPHQGAPLCEGSFGGTNLPSDPQTLVFGGRVAMCPWHHMEFDLRSGVSLTDSRLRVKTYPVEVEDGKLLLTTRGGLK